MKAPQAGLQYSQPSWNNLGRIQLRTKKQDHQQGRFVCFHFHHWDSGDGAPRGLWDGGVKETTLQEIH